MMPGLSHKVFECEHGLKWLLSPISVAHYVSKAVSACLSAVWEGVCIFHLFQREYFICG